MLLSNETQASVLYSYKPIAKRTDLFICIVANAGSAFRCGWPRRYSFATRPAIATYESTIIAYRGESDTGKHRNSGTMLACQSKQSVNHCQTSSTCSSTVAGRGGAQGGRGGEISWARRNVIAVSRYKHPRIGYR